MTNQRHDDKELIKAAFKEASREFLDDAYRAAGRWSLRALFAAIMVALIYFILAANGWHHAAFNNVTQELRRFG